MILELRKGKPKTLIIKSTTTPIKLIDMAAVESNRFNFKIIKLGELK